MKPDLIVIQPDAFRYRLYERWLSHNCIFFNKIILRFTRSNLPFDVSDDVNEFLLKEREIPNIQITWEPRNVTGDWRDSATKEALLQSTSDWVCFMEQDFEIHSTSFLTTMLNNMNCCPMRSFFGFKEGDRIHPACLFVHTAIINTIREAGMLNFSPIPNVADHFARFTRALENFKMNFVSFESLGYKTPDDYYHMAGLTHNMYLESQGLPIGHKPEEFEVYMNKCRELEAIERSRKS